jgi:hypothetical protein
MAIRLSDSKPVANGDGTYTMIEHWAYFIRNYGQEGGCSSWTSHPWPPVSRDSSGRGICHIQLPWPVSATGAPIGGRVELLTQPEENYGPPELPTQPWFTNLAWMWQKGESWGYSYKPGFWTSLDFHLPFHLPPYSGGADGDVFLAYTLPSNQVKLAQAMPRSNAITRSAAAEGEKEIDWSQIQKHITDPKASAQLLNALKMRRPTTTSSGESMALTGSAGIAASGQATINAAIFDAAPGSLDAFAESRLAAINAALAQIRQ